MSHISVLLEESLTHLLSEETQIERVIDGTLGAGGHTEAFLQRTNAQVMAFDLDTSAIEIAKERLKDYRTRLHIEHDSYVTMKSTCDAKGWESVDAILLDLGVSSMQLDQAERGFAFAHDAPLDMRFDMTSNQPTASDIVNQWDESDLAHIFYRYGEEKFSRQIARAIVTNRPITHTQELADLIKQTVPINRKKKNQTKSSHPATRTFQALRIVVNDELQQVERVIPDAIDLLRSGGRLGIISFHSLEDRIVKQAFKEASLSITAPPGMASIETKDAIIKLITRKPLIASEEEVSMNPRSRSAKLRVIEKI